MQYNIIRESDYEVVRICSTQDEADMVWRHLMLVREDQEEWYLIKEIVHA